jgi:hypothetical protein
MKIGLGVSIGVEMLLHVELVIVGDAIDVDVGKAGVDVDVGVEEAGAGVDDEDFAALLVHVLEIALVVGAGTGAGWTIVAVTCWVTVSPGLTISTVFVVSITEVAVGGAAVDESPPTLTTA